MFFPNKPDEDWYWLVVLNIVYLSLFHIVSSVFAEVFLTLIVWKKYSASIPSTRMAKESTVVKKEIRWAGPSQRRREQRRVRGVVNYCPSIGSQNRAQVYRCRSPSIKGRSALVNIRRKALLSSVGFRKHMTSRSPRSVICDSSALRSSISDLFDFWWEILSHFFDHSSIDSNQFKQEDATASV